MFRFFVFFCALSGLIAFGHSPQEKPLVIVGIPPYKCLVQSIAGETVDVKVVVPVGHNPHDYEMGLKDILKLKESVLWFRSGETFELNINKFLKANNSPCIITNLQEGLNLIPLDTENTCSHHKNVPFDTHIWMSPSLLKKQAHTIAKVLSKTFPENVEFYKDRLEQTIRIIDDLDLHLREILREVPPEKKVFLTNHSACAYLCRDYDLRQITINGHSSEPTFHYLAALKAEAENLSIHTIFVQKQHGTRSANKLAKQLKAKIVFFDPYHEDVFANLIFIITAIAKQ